MTDPRRHPFVVAVDGPLITYRCGCVNTTADPSGVLRCASKCPEHRAAWRDPSTLDEAYYRENGALDADALARYVGELVECLGLFPVGEPGDAALEVGCGVSPYLGEFRAAGYVYAGLDASPWAAAWMERVHKVVVFPCTLEAAVAKEYIDTVGWRLILAAHVLEHLDDAPGAVAKLASMLAPGGELWVIVPDDEDPCNPDHGWFFTPSSLSACATRAGLTVLGLAVRRRIEREQFIYLRARKPA